MFWVTLSNAALNIHVPDLCFRVGFSQKSSRRHEKARTFRAYAGKWYND